MLLCCLPVIGQVVGDHTVRCVKITSDNKVTLACICESGDRLWHDTNCDRTKDSGEEFIDLNAKSECTGTTSYLDGEGNCDTIAAAHGDGANCAAGEIPLGVDAAGAVQGCYEPTEADITDLSHTTDTGPSPDCTGTSTYQDGGGACDTVGGDISGGLDAVVVTDDSHNHIITNIDAFTKAQLATQTSDVLEYAEADGEVFTGVNDFGGAVIEIANGASPTVDAAGEIAIDTTNDDIIYFGAAKRVIPYEQVLCKVVENLKAGDDNMPLFSPGDNITLVEAWCHCTTTASGCTTAADLSLETVQIGTTGPQTIDDVTGTIDCELEDTGDAKTALSGTGSTVDALDLVRFDVDNTPVLESDTYTLCFSYTVDAQ